MIKPCPFCGEQPELLERFGSVPGTYYASFLCFCGGYTITAFQFGVANTPEKALEIALNDWNKRNENP
jgi:Lar family restriction alleviation protein